MIYRILFIILFTQFLQAQETLPNLLDSLAQTRSNSDKARLGMVVASKLAHIDWKRALNYIEIAEESANKSRSEKTIADFHIGMAEIYSDKDALDISLGHFVKAYDYYQNQPLNDRYRLENNLAIAYARTDNEEKALKYFKKLFNYDRTRENPINFVSMSNNLGRVWMGKNLDSSMFYFNKSLEIVKEVDQPDLKLFLYTNLGKVYIMKGDLNSARAYFNLAMNEIQPKTSGQKVAWLYNEYSELFLRNEKLDSAIYYSQKAVNILDSLAPFGFEHYRAVGNLYKSYVEDGDYKLASNYFEKYLTISDSLNLADKRVNVQKLLIGEEYRHKQKIHQLEQSKRRANNYMLFLGLFALLLILGWVLYRYHNKLKRTELEKQLATAKQLELNSNLELKNKELIGKAMVELHRAEIIEDILMDLKNLKLKADNREVQSTIDNITKRLKVDTSSNIWAEFEVRFEKVHESFYKNLILAHPDLTPRDKRLCALLKLNLTTKEVAQITGQPSKSIENSRTRLRKKLEITNFQTDLSTYLSNF